MPHAFTSPGNFAAALDSRSHGVLRRPPMPAGCSFALGVSLSSGIWRSIPGVNFKGPALIGLNQNIRP
jgi:hypothetical protein